MQIQSPRASGMTPIAVAPLDCRPSASGFSIRVLVWVFTAYMPFSAQLITLDRMADSSLLLRERRFTGPVRQGWFS